MRSLLLLVAMLAPGLEACRYLHSPDTATPQPTIRPKQELPFSTKEPEIYQADVFVTAGPVIDHFFVARQRNRTRTDIFAGSELEMTEIIGHSRIVIDHRQKTYYEQASATEPSGVASPIASFFAVKKYSTYEELGRQGDMVNYRVHVDGSSDDILISVDTKTGLVLVQQFTAADGSVTVKYELRDLRLEADDSLFQVPDGYRQVAAPLR